MTPPALVRQPSFGESNDDRSFAIESRTARHPLVKGGGQQAALVIKMDSLDFYKRKSKSPDRAQL